MYGLRHDRLICLVWEREMGPLPHEYGCLWCYPMGFYYASLIMTSVRVHDTKHLNVA